MRIPAALSVAALLTGTCAPAPDGDNVDWNPTVLVAAAAPAGGQHGHQAHPPVDRDGHRTHAASPTAGAPTDHSLYHLSGQWTDQDGVEAPLGRLAGRVQVVAMVYTHCTFACPRILARMKALEARLSDGTQDDVGFVLVSIDPGRDTPPRLRRFADDTRLDTRRWTLLSGDDADVLALSVLLGVKYRATADGEFTHSNILTVLNREGEVMGRVEGLEADLAPVLAAVRGALGTS